MAINQDQKGFQKTGMNNQGQKPSVQTPNSDSLTKNLGDKIERVGEKIRDAGAQKIGTAIHDVGDKIEHMKDRK